MPMPVPSILYMVVPCYNDEETLLSSVPFFLAKLDSLISSGAVSAKSRLVLINDGSADRTWERIAGFQQANAGMIIGLNLAGNYGEQNALIAGMTFARDKADCVVTIDSDLQDDINVVEAMLERYYAGNDVVLGVRDDRRSDGALEKLCSKLFYRVMEAGKTGLVNEHSNYRLLSKRAITRLTDGLPANYFLPCAASTLGMPCAVVTYRRFQRISGTSGYNLSKKLRLGKDALFSHSDYPLSFLTKAGVLSLLAAAVLFVLSFCLMKTATTVWFLPLSVLLLLGAGGFFGLRIVGEYAYKAFTEAKKPVKFRIDTVLQQPDGEE